MSFFDWIRTKGWEQAPPPPLELPADASPTQIRRTIHLLLDRDRADEAANALSSVAAQARPLLEEALSDDRFHDSDNWLPLRACSVFEVVLDLLREAGSDAHLREGVRLATSSNPHDRQIAAAFLPQTGDAKYAQTIGSLLCDADPIVQDRTFEGLIEAARAGRLSPEIGSRIYGLLRSQALRKDRGPSPHAAELMLLIDRARATADLTAADALSLECTWLTWNLRALKEIGVLITADTVASLLDGQLQRINETDERSEKSIAASSAADLLALLAELRPADLERRAEALIEHPSEWLRNEAARVLLDLAGLGPIAATFNAHQSIGWDGMALPQQYLYAVHLLDCEVRNGGFLQYFSNSWGSQADMARRGLQEMGARSAAEIVDHAIAFFGRGGVPEDRDQRNSVLSAALTRDVSPFSSLDSRWYADPDHLEVCIMRYARKHPELFIAPPRK